MRGAIGLGVALAILGGLLIAYSLATGGASAELVFIVPVFSGGSGAFLLGVFLLFLGFFVAALGSTAELTERDRFGPPTERLTGGLILLGPVPILWGDLRPASRRLYLACVIVAIAVTVTLVVGIALWLRTL